jgi:hypothetical protein
MTLYKTNEPSATHNTLYEFSATHNTLSEPSATYSYLILFNFHKKKYDQFTSYFIPDEDISSLERVSLDAMQSRGQIDPPKYGRLSKENIANLDAIVLYLFESQSKFKNELEFIESRKDQYQKFYEKDFEGIGKWVKHKRESNVDSQCFDKEISHIYELVDDTYEK